VHAITREAVLVTTPIAVSLRASERLPNHRLRVCIVYILDNRRKLEQSCADIQSCALSGRDVDRESHAILLGDQLHDTAGLREVVTLSDGEDRGAFQRFEDLAGSLGITAADVKQMTGAKGPIRLHDLRDEFVAPNGPTFDDLFDRIRDGVVADDAEGESLGWRKLGDHQFQSAEYRVDPPEQDGRIDGEGHLFVNRVPLLEREFDAADQ
jgi:hypothetical protein